MSSCCDVSLCLLQRKEKLVVRIHNGSCEKVFPFLRFTIGPVALDSVVIAPEDAQKASVLCYTLRSGCTNGGYDVTIRFNKAICVCETVCVEMSIGLPGLTFQHSRVDLIGCITCFHSEHGKGKCCNSLAAVKASECRGGCNFPLFPTCCSSCCTSLVFSR